MTEYEVNYLLSELAAHQRELVEFWLTCSFAVIVASTYAPDKIVMKFYRIMSIGYLANSFLLISLKIGHMMRAGEIASESAAHTGQNTSNYVTGVSGLLLMLLMICGTFAVLHYLKQAMGASSEENT